MIHPEISYRRAVFGVLWLVTALQLAGCRNGHAPDPEAINATAHLVSDSVPPLVEGGEYPIYVRVGCTSSGSQVNCPGVQLVSLDRFEVANGAVAEARPPTLDKGSARLTIAALQVGQTELSLSATDSRGKVHTLTVSVDVRRATRATLQPECDAGATAPFLIPKSATFRVVFQLFDGDTQLWGTSFFPFDPGPFTLVATDFGRATLRAPATPASGRITSKVDPATGVDIQLYDASNIDGAEVHLAPPAPAEPVVVRALPTAVAVDATWSIGDRRACVALPVKYSVTSGSCSLTQDGKHELSGASSRFQVYGPSEGGNCYFQVSVEGGTGKTLGRVRFKSVLPDVDAPWDWENPLPQGQWLYGMGGSGPDDVYAVGADVAMRWNGSAWSIFRVDATLTAVWSSGPTNAWASGFEGALLHWDGVRWTPVESGAFDSLNALSGTGPNDVWAVGNGGTILHWNGAAWSRVRSGVSTYLSSVLAFAPNDAWAGGEGGVLHWNGVAWSPVSTGALVPDRVGRLFGTGPSDLWVGGPPGTLLRWNGSAWSSVPTGVNEAITRGLSLAPTEAFVATSQAILRWDGQAWSPFAVPPRGLYGLWGTAANALWVAGAAGVIEQWNGSSWTKFHGGVDGLNREVHGIWGTAPDNVWAVGSDFVNTSSIGIVLHRDATGWTQVPGPFDHALNGVWGTGPNDVWAVGERGLVVHFDGVSWQQVPTGSTGDRLMAVWGSGPNNVYAVGWNNAGFRWDGSKFNRISIHDNSPYANPDFNAIWGTGPNDIWVVGDTLYGTWEVRHWNGLFWFGFDPPGTAADMMGIWGTAGNDVWMSGGALLHFDGWTLSRVNVFGAGAFGRVWGSGPNDLRFGTGLRYDGSQWSRTPFRGGVLFGLDANNVWAGDNYLQLRRLKQ